jgi:large subunit ribosomal protein L25
MEFTIHHREKKHTKKLRRLDNIPAVIYAKGKENENIYLKQDQLSKNLAFLKPGELSTCIFTLKGEKETFKALVKDIQYFVTSYKVAHIDFMRLDENIKITVNVPIRIIGVAECKGIKQGGNLHQIIRTIKIRSLPKNLPKEFVIDIADMDLGQTKRLSDIALPKGVESVSKRLNEVVVAITKR